MGRDLQTFLDTRSHLPKLIVIYGPTASGKTSVSIEMAQELKSEIISADSRQIYRQMDIGTAKITQEEMDGVKHHMIDIIDPDQSYSVGEWVREVREVCERLRADGKIPIICGGTGLYIDALIHGFSIPEVPADEELRSELEEYRKSNGNEALWNKLKALDPDYADEIHPNNWTYVIRGIEVFRATGISKKGLKVAKEPIFDAFMTCPFKGDREELYARIDLRVEQMVDEGLIEEVRAIVTNYEYQIPDVVGILEKLPGLNAIGYKEVLQHFSGEYDIDRCIELIQQHSRNYAKRQLTWFRKYV